MGSTFIERRAGKQHAASATAVKSIDRERNVKGSVAVTPNKRLAPARSNHSAPISPSPSPAKLSFDPSPMTMRKISPAWAPIAKRVAIECCMSP